MSYTKTTWRNNQAPAINADNLNHMEQGIESAHNQIDVNTSNIESLTTQVQNNATNIASEISARQTTDSSLQSQIDQLVAPTGEAPNPAEIENARIGDDGVTYDTLGNAIRTQFSDLKSELGGLAKTFTANANGTRKFNVPLLKGIKYTFTNNTSDTCVLNLYKSDGTSKSIYQPVNKDQTVTFVVDGDGYVSFGGWFNGSGTVTIATDFALFDDYRLRNLYDYAHIFDWQVGSIFGDNGTNYNAPQYCIRTPNPNTNIGRYIENDAVAISVNPLIKTVFAFKYAIDGTYIGRLGDGGKSVSIDGGYCYRFVLMADSSITITAETIGNYSSDFYVGGNLLADIISSIYENAMQSYTGYVIGTDLIKRTVKVNRIGSGNIAKPDAFVIYDDKYYSVGESGLCVQNSSFSVLQTVSMSIGHANGFILGSTNKGYVSGWNDNKVYVIDLDELSIIETITLPTTGYTTCAVDDVNGIIYIFQRDTLPNTLENYNLIVYDYVNDEVKARYKTDVPFAAMQDCDIFRDKIVVINGLGAQSAPNGYRVYNTQGRILAEYFLDDFESIEPEGVFFDRTNGELYFCTYTGALYKITD